MSTFVSLGNFISINKKLSIPSIAFKLFCCKPLMPRNPLKRLRVVYNYLILFRRNNVSNEHILRSDGDVAIKVVDSNYKVINLKRKIIQTIFDEENEDKICGSLIYKDSSTLYEKIWDIDKENRIITGLFYNGHHPNLNKTKSKILKNRLTDMFISLLAESDIRNVNARVYAKSLVDLTLEILDRNSEGITEKESRYVRNFLVRIYERFIKNNEERFIQLTLSHGDIKEDNLLVQNNKIVLIDWEFCGFRSPTFDLIKFKTRFPNFGDDFYSKLNKYLFDKLSNKTKRGNELIQRYMNNYLDLFYLEDITLRLIQFENREFAKDFSKIIKFIKRHSNYES
ncbi:Choline/ethanolamine kinase [Virgibacillus subterraneus]|uniref:Choline/ethanolamine kinase n=1 Tax=Virgibacillus subterraneus TaxID=621109 RepID=A0A1H8ZS26_9BACI|nr:phosphotransferase [Virgibacillus subterraneus]SEP67299.1 Choline/ethanolamine kinase [Virgibacillus subterraneus]